MVSWLGFWIDVRAVPARISLGLLTLLGLLTEGSSVGSKLPRFTYVKAIDVWIIACLLFVIAALAEFAAAYMLAPQEKQNEWDEELRLVIRGILEKKLGSSRCCCCYTKSTNHKPVLFTSRSGHSFQPGDDSVGERPTENKSLSKGHLHGKKSLELNTSSSFTKCGLCDSLQPDCCTCPLCERLQCPKAPRSVAHQRKTFTSDAARATNTCTSNNTDRRHIVICEPSLTFRSRTSGPKRIGAGTGGISTGSFPKKSALKVSRPSSSPASSLYERNRHETRRSRRLNRSYLSRQTNNDAANVPPSNTEIRTQHPVFSSRSPFCFCRLKCGTPPSHSKRLRLGQSVAESAIPPLGRKSAQKLETYDSEVDAYSRFLFPACFVLFNCCYWLFYMVIADGNPPKPS
ncbi:Glutamate-gated chloride channel [Fasciola gigantica]|uniref:Glutamate-gated chloride channel n=1 Tax=Fasciola gigantica TaxID=46835 RepID=A0A504YYQ5_FASGI|nr:Glutamate-gated chloride channel [Fasciola gigantica]